MSILDFKKMIIRLFYKLFVMSLYTLFLGQIHAKFIHHSEVVAEIKKRFVSIKTYKANFNITIMETGKRRKFSGIIYYKKGGKINFTFLKPTGDLIISNGRKMWVYVKRLNTVGVQILDKKKSNLYQSASYEGLVSLFQRYHYRFSSTEQPQDIFGYKHYVLSLDEKVDSGGFHKITLFVNANTKLIRRLVALSRSGRKVKLEFKHIKLDEELPNSLFTYRVKGNTRVVENPLTVN